MLFGALHAYLIGFGDILYPYALSGLLICSPIHGGRIDAEDATCVVH